jgi:hypothetical protein
MKKVLFIAVALVAFMFASCKKDNLNPNPKLELKSVEAISGSFMAKDGDVTFTKSYPNAPLAVNRTWSMYAKNSPFYGNVPFSLVNGSEFITGSVAQLFWANSANNPITFPASQSVYSNLTPDENLRIISESKDVNGVVAYLGILDFKPSQVNFPLTVNCFRLGDVLVINTDQLTSLPGGNHLTFSVAYNLAPVDLAATKMGAITGINGVPNGTQFQWSDIVYGTSLSTNTSIGAGNFVVYEGLDKKVMGSIVITITDTYTGINNDQPVRTITLPAITAKDAGKGLKLTLHTDKIGWLDSGVITFSDKDIEVIEETIVVN